MVKKAVTVYVDEVKYKLVQDKIDQYEIKSVSDLIERAFDQFLSMKESDEELEPEVVA